MSTLPPNPDLADAVGVTSIHAWRGRFAGDPEPDGSTAPFDAVVLEFGVDVGDLPPLIVPLDAVAGLAAVIVQAASLDADLAVDDEEPLTDDES